MTAQTERLNTALAGRYTIERELGAGGMATVYLAHDLKHDRRVALKVLKPELAAVLGAERFVVEIKTTAALQHPHILPLFDSGTADSFLFYVMPWIEGETLRDKLNREKQLGVDEAVRITREVADALDYAHRHGVIHRDIKPENILLHDGRPMVADFGIALALSAAAGGRMTETGLSLGTPHYMSPEQATAEKEITARSDVYSLGSVLYEMLTGNPPHVGVSAQQIIMKIITEPAAPVTQFRKAVPPNVAAAVAKSLEKLPADRFESAKAFGDALGNPAYTSAAVAGVAPTPARARQQRVRDALLVGALVAVVAVPATWWVTARRTEPPLAVHFAFATAPNQPLGIVPGRTVALSPDGRIVVYATLDSTGRARLFKRLMDDLTQEPIAGTDGAQYPFFSPDGRWLGFWDGQQLKKIPVEGGTPTPLAGVTGSNFGASWGPSGIVVSINRKLMLVPSGGGTPVSLARGDSVEGVWPVLLPDGKAVVYSTTLTGESHLAVAVLSTGRTAALDLLGRAPLGVAGGELIYARGDGALMAIPFDAGARRVTGSARVVVNEVAQNPTGESKAAVSPSGALAYSSGAELVQAVAVDMHGAVRPLAIPPGRLSFPRYSPDGRRIAANLINSGGRMDVWIYDVTSGAAHRVTSDGSTNMRPEWTPDGTRVLFRSDRAGQNASLWWQPADGSGAAEQFVASPGKIIWEGVLTPDGHAAVYRTGAGQIWYRRLAGDTAEHRIATTPFNEQAPRVSPDGRWVAYQSDESGSAQVVVSPFPGPGAQTTVSIGGGSTPVWSRDGRRIFYTNGTKLLAASVATSPTFAVTAREVLFEGDYFRGTGHATFDVSQDGKSFLMLRPVAEHAEQIVVIPNWAAELRAQAAKR